MDAGQEHRYEVVVNDDGRYSVWRAGRPFPDGWHAVGVRGSESDCLDWIGRNWADVLPRPVRGAAGVDAPVDRPVPRHEGGAGEPPALGRDETRDAVAAGTGPPAFDDGSTVPDHIERAARKFPRRRAVTFGAESLSYAELDRRASVLAHRLRALGVGADDVVAVYGDRSLPLIVALVGILKSGAAYLPLDPSHPPRRLADMVADAAPVLLLADGEPPRFAPGCPVADLRELAAGTGDPDNATTRHPDSLAYVIFTSGSTGRPKGVQNTHRALYNRLRWMQAAYPIDGTDAVLQKTPLSFDVSVWEVFWPLTVGAHLVMVRPGGHRDPDHLAELINRHRVTVVHFVPSMLRAFLRAGALAACPGLRHVICSGEALSPQLRASFLAVSGARLHNLYGPTEAAIDVTCYDCDAGRDPDTVPIGRAISGLRVHVLGSGGVALPAGATGEIVIGGIGLARGYAGRPALTAERFVPDPVGPPGERLYRTGDLGRRRPDGLIEFLGRADDQVALRGFRIELDEVRTAIERVTGIRQAAVTAWSDESGAAGLAAYLVWEHDAGQEPDRVRAELAGLLPDYMIPTVWSVLPELPTLPSGKIDRRRLPAPVIRPGTAQAAADGRSAQRWTDSERQVAQAWARVLGTPPAHPDDDFFRSGGDSILSVELVVAARALGLSLTVGKIFENRTPRRLAAVTERAGAPAEPEPGPFELLPADRRAELAPAEDAFPLSTLLSGLLFESRVNPDYRVYVTSLRLAGAFDATLLDRAVRMLLRRHPFLRTSVDLDGLEPVQVVHHEVPNVLTIVDLRGSGPARRTGEFDRWLAAVQESRFDWSAPPLLRLTAHRFTDTEFRLTLTEPFLDGWSVTLALSELLDYYRTLLAGQEPDVVAVRAQASFLRLERAALADGGTRDYWRAVLTDPPTGGLPRGRRPVRRRVRAVPVSAATSQRLRLLADQLTVSLKSVLLAAHVQVVALLTGRAEVLTGLIANARPETAHGVHAVGMFLNTIPLRLDVDTPSARDLVTAVHAAEAGALRHRTYPYAQMLRDSGLTRPLETVFNFTHFHPYRRFVHDGPVRTLAVDATDQTYHRLTAQFRQDVISGDVGLTLEFADREFDEDQIDRIAGYYAAALEQLAEAPDRPVTPLDRLLSAAERAGLEPPGPAPAGTAPATAPEPVDLYTLFARQARRTPDADALRYSGRRVTYAELDARATELAGRLTALGVGPGDFVAVHLERSPGYVAAVLGVLRTGAAYMPVDPRHPAERVARILAASGTRIVLTGAGHGARLPDDMVRLHIEPIPEPIPEPARPAGDRADHAADRAADRPAATAPPASPAVLVFTSGSTGDPKGVVLAHSAVVNRLAWSLAAEPDKPDEVFLLRTPVGFVDAVAELFDGLVRGAPTVILPDAADSPDELVSTIAGNEVTRVTLVPTLLGEVLRLDRDLTRVRQWHLSGEPLRGELVRALRAQQPKAVVRNLYGTTEVCADATVHTCADDDCTVVPAGTALPGVTVVVLHEDGGLAPFDTPGELAVGGRALAIGYLGDTRATARRFVPSAYGRGERLYRTGDLAVRRTDGVLELLGRADRQIKIRGVRVEPAEVEANLVAHPDVAQALVVQRAHRGRQALVGYVRPTGHPGSLGPALRAYLRDRLPNAAVPEVFVPVTGWPRLPSGKIDVAALPDPVTAASAASRAARAPSGPLETELAALWQRELGSAPTDVDDDFWDLGGHSLSAVVLALSIERHTGVPFGVADLYAHSTLSAQARLIERLRASR